MLIYLPNSMQPEPLNPYRENAARAFPAVRRLRRSRLLVCGYQFSASQKPSPAPAAARRAWKCQPTDFSPCVPLSPAVGSGAVALTPQSRAPHSQSPRRAGRENRTGDKRDALNNLGFFYGI